MKRFFSLSLFVLLSMGTLAQPSQKVVLRTHAFGME